MTNFWCRVWLARHKEINEYVTIKLLKSDLVDEKDSEMFQREAEILRFLDHENI